MAKKSRRPSKKPVKPAKSVKKSIKESIKDLKTVKVNWLAGLRKSLRFSIGPKRWLPFFLVDLATVCILLLLVFNNPLLLDPLYAGMIPPEAIMLLIVEVAIVAILWVLLNIWIQGALVHQSWKPNEFRKSWFTACKKYPSLLGTMVIIALVMFIVSLVPFVGEILVVIVPPIIFLFPIQFIMVDGKGFFEALSRTVQTFRHKVLKVVVTWLLATIFSTIIIAIFAIPLLGFYLYYASIYGMDMAVVYLFMYVERTWIYLVGAVFLVGVSISKTFVFKFLTEIYLQLKKKRFLIF